MTVQHLLVKRDACFRWKIKFNSEFNPLTLKIQITKVRSFQKWLEEEALLMISLVLILAILLKA